MKLLKLLVRGRRCCRCYNSSLLVMWGYLNLPSDKNQVGVGGGKYTMEQVAVL